jgi:RND family efflux transporter MFP subunit
MTLRTVVYLSVFGFGLMQGQSHAAETQGYQARAVIKAYDRAVLSAELAGKIAQMPKRMGETFKKGDTLVALDCAIFKAQRDKVSAEREAAQTKVENNRQLNKLNSIGKLEVAISEAELKKIEAELRIATLNTERCNIRAPYDGEVVALQANEHESVREQQPLIEILSNHQLEAEIIVPANWIGWLKETMPISLVMDETGKEIKTTIHRISPMIDPVSQTIQLRAKIQDNDAMAGMSASAKLTPIR